MGKFALLVGVRIDQMTDFVGGLLRLACEAAAEDDDVLVDVVYLIGYSVDNVDSPCGCP